MRRSRRAMRPASVQMAWTTRKEKKNESGRVKWEVMIAVLKGVKFFLPVEEDKYDAPKENPAKLRHRRKKWLQFREHDLDDWTSETSIYKRCGFQMAPHEGARVYTVVVDVAVHTIILWRMHDVNPKRILGNAPSGVSD